MTGAYERELREVLSGTEKGVTAVTRSCTLEEKDRMPVSYTHLTLPTKA